MKRAQTTLVFALALGGCASEADLVLEIHRTSTSSPMTFAVCDGAHPEKCETLNEARFGGGTVFELGLYFDSAITPPLQAVLSQAAPSTCRVISVDPGAASDRVVIEFRPNPGDDVVISGCEAPGCGQAACPTP